MTREEAENLLKNMTADDYKKMHEALKESDAYGQKNMEKIEAAENGKEKTADNL